VIIYRATLDVPGELAKFLARLLLAERRRRGTPRGSRALTCFWQAVLGLRWFRDRTSADALARDHGVSRATAYRYLDEVISVLADQAPDLRGALERARDQGFSHMILDGKIIVSDRCKEPALSVKGEVIDLWYSGKAHCHGGSIQAVMAPTGFPLRVSGAEPGSVHDITAARIHALPARYQAAAAGLRTLADPGYARARLRGSAELDEVFSTARLLRLLHATDALAWGLSDIWDGQAAYPGAADTVRRILADQLVSGRPAEPHPVTLMNMHKSKGKEFGPDLGRRAHHPAAAPAPRRHHAGPARRGLRTPRRRRTARAPPPDSPGRACDKAARPRWTRAAGRTAGPAIRRPTLPWRQPGSGHDAELDTPRGRASSPARRRGVIAARPQDRMMTPSGRPALILASRLLHGQPPSRLLPFPSPNAGRAARGRSWPSLRQPPEPLVLTTAYRRAPRRAGTRPGAPPAAHGLPRCAASGRS